MVKVLEIFKNIMLKAMTFLPDSNRKLKFDVLQILDKESLSANKSSNSESKKSAPKKPRNKLTKTQIGQNHKASIKGKQVSNT